MTKKIVLFFIFYFGTCYCFSQIQNTLNAGIYLQYGKPLKRIGIFGGYSGQIIFFQFNSQFRIFKNFLSYGPPNKKIEFQLTNSFIFAYGHPFENKKTIPTRPYDEQLKQKHKIGYIHQIYIDKVKTSQNTGSLLLKFGNFFIISENDLWGTKVTDSYRTAAIRIGYEQNNRQLSLNAILWTGNAMAAKRQTAPDYPSRFGFKDLTNVPYGRFSHGIFNLHFSQILPYNQNLCFNTGIDSEYVRHILQNRFIHDMYFLPLKLVPTPNPHYPMLTPNGEPYLYKNEQKIKPTTFSYQFSLNPTIFY